SMFWTLLNPNGGAIALMTTTRSVFYGVNSETGEKFYKNVFERDVNFKPKTFGEIMRLTKNEANSSSNKRSFTLIGDPALRIALPEYSIKIDSINSFSPNLYQDTLEALSKVRIKGHLEDYNQVVLSGFNGVLTPSIFDKKKINQTLNQNTETAVIDFEIQKNILYKGKATVTNGYFDFTFIVPKDINYNYGKGKISLYANSETQDASGLEEKIIIGGVNPLGLMDNVGPEIDMYFNEENFVDGGFTDENPILIAKLFDENGINTIGNGIGHDIMAIIDEESSKPIVLNNYYSADLDTYQSGSLRYNLSGLEPGTHSLKLKVWDVNNNLSESKINFEVQLKQDFELRNVLNYPNPFTTNTAFYFEHNQLCSDLEVQIQIFTVSGKLVKTINQLVYNECYRSEGITWNGLDDFGDQLAKGVYIYNLTVTNPENQTANKIEKLVILK
ncbi:MAG: type IX secretion system sortase PorU, partial [Bacteroidota bacterium]